MFAGDRILLLIAAVVAGLGLFSMVGLFLYGLYAGLGSSIVINNF